MMFPSNYSINDLEQLTGIKAHTIRIWEKRYALIKPERSQTNIRSYSNDDLRRLLNVSFLNKQGIKISAIATLSDREISEKVLAVNLIHSGKDDLIEGLLLGMISMSEFQFEKVFSTAILRMGFEKAILQVIFPFLQRIGIMWQAGGINPAQEHFMSNIIRQKIIVATDSLKLVDSEKTKKALLFLPENELHEISLLFYNYALRSRQINTIYLGQSVPVSSLARVINITNPDILVTVFINNMHESGLEKMMYFLKPIAEEKLVFISGFAAFENKDKIPPKAHLFKNLEELLSFL